jgi:hypothetical protein
VDAAAESGGFTDRTESGDELAVVSERTRRQVSLDAAQGLSRQDVQFDANEWAGGAVGRDVVHARHSERGWPGARTWTAVSGATSSTACW